MVRNKDLARRERTEMGADQRCFSQDGVKFKNNCQVTITFGASVISFSATEETSSGGESG